MGGWGVARVLVMAAFIGTGSIACAELNRAIAGRDLVCSDADPAQCVAMADAAARALEPGQARSVTRVELADTRCDTELWWDGEDMPADVDRCSEVMAMTADVDRCSEVMAMTADGWRRGIVVRFDDGRLHVAW